MFWIYKNYSSHLKSEQVETCSRLGTVLTHYTHLYPTATSNPVTPKLTRYDWTDWIELQKCPEVWLEDIMHQWTCGHSIQCTYIYTRRPRRSPTLKHTPCPVSVLFAVTAFWRLGVFFWTKCYGMDCFGTYFTHVQTCDVTRVQSATEWTASVHTLHMSKPVM